MIQCLAKMDLHFIFFVNIDPYQMTTAAALAPVTERLSAHIVQKKWTKQKMKNSKKMKKKKKLKGKMGIQFIYLFDKRTSDYTSRLQDKVVAFDFRSGITNIIRRLCSSALHITTAYMPCCVWVRVSALACCWLLAHRWKWESQIEPLCRELFAQKHIQNIYYFE